MNTLFFATKQHSKCAWEDVRCKKIVNATFEQSGDWKAEVSPVQAATPEYYLNKNVLGEWVAEGSKGSTIEVTITNLTKDSVTADFNINVYFFGTRIIESEKGVIGSFENKDSFGRIFVRFNVGGYDLTLEYHGEYTSLDCISINGASGYGYKLKKVT